MNFGKWYFMDKITKLRFYIKSLCIYDFKNDIVVDALYNLLSSVESESVLEAQSNFYNALIPHQSLCSYISKLILTHDNVFTKASAANKTLALSKTIIDGVKSDLKKLEAISSITNDDIIRCVKSQDIISVLQTMPAWENGTPKPPFKKNWHNSIDQLSSYYNKNGYGKFAKYIAFEWRNGTLYPISSIDPIKLSDLKKYERQRNQVVENTEGFVKGLSANNVLLYGDRGTGKSSTIHAILNEFAKDGLRMIELPKKSIDELTIIRELLADSPMKFIIYIDDLSFDGQDDSFTELKAALEGSLSAKQENTLIYATSNRRHLIRESFKERNDDINRGDTMQEQLSLSDRFGLSITFMNPDKADYLEIVEKLAEDRNIEANRDKLLLKAEQWATRRGGRSPRCARQFIDYAESALKLKKEW